MGTLLGRKPHRARLPEQARLQGSVRTSSRGTRGPAGSVGGGPHGVLEAGAECTQRCPGERGSSRTGLSWEPMGERRGVEGPQMGERELGLWLSKN